MTNEFTYSGNIKATDDGVLRVRETTTPTSAVLFGAFYTKSDKCAYFQDGDGTEHKLAFTGQGAMTLLDEVEVTATTSFIAFTSGIDTTYDEYEFRFYNMTIDTNGENLRGQLSIDGGATYVSANSYTYIGEINPSSGVPGLFFGNTVDFLRFNGNTGNNIANGENFSGYINAMKPNETATRRTFLGQFTSIGGNGSTAYSRGSGTFVNTTDAWDAIQFFMSDGAFIGGTVRMYGIAKS